MTIEPNPYESTVIADADDLLAYVRAYGDNTATEDGPETEFVVMPQRDFDDIVAWICEHDVEGPNGESIINDLFFLPITLKEVATT